jgi:hypothetical protein
MLQLLLLAFSKKIDLQVSYTGLLFEQIRNSQETEQAPMHDTHGAASYMDILTGQCGFEVKKIKTIDIKRKKNKACFDMLFLYLMQETMIQHSRSSEFSHIQ